MLVLFYIMDVKYVVFTKPHVLKKCRILKRIICSLEHQQLNYVMVHFELGRCACIYKGNLKYLKFEILVKFAKN